MCQVWVELWLICAKYDENIPMAETFSHCRLKMAPLVCERPHTQAHFVVLCFLARKKASRELRG